MQLILVGFFGFLVVLAPTLASGEKSTYNLQIDDHSFNLQYEIEADVLAMAIDQELTSLLIGIENTQDSNFSIELPAQMISSENNEFSVLVDSFEIGYDLISNEDMITLSFFVPQGSQEIEIIGTHVIPEFPFGIIVGFSLIMSVTILFSKYKQIK